MAALWVLLATTAWLTTWCGGGHTSTAIAGNWESPVTNYFSNTLIPWTEKSVFVNSSSTAVGVGVGDAFAAEEGLHVLPQG